MRIAISGHRGLPADTERLVDAEIRNRLAAEPVHELVGISCLADGADQLFARAVLDVGGQLEVIVPAEQYRAGLPAECWSAYYELQGKAVRVRELDHVESTEQSHMDASRAMLDAAGQLYAVWDRKPARGYGGTADVVALAHDRGLVVWTYRSSGRTAQAATERRQDERTPRHSGTRASPRLRTAATAAVEPSSPRTDGEVPASRRRTV